VTHLPSGFEQERGLQIAKTLIYFTPEEVTSFARDIALRTRSRFARTAQTNAAFNRQAA
jgi:hypothetical protein